MVKLLFYFSIKGGACNCPPRDKEGSAYLLTLLSELWFAFLDRGHHHVTHTSSRKSVQSSLDPLHRDDIQIFGSYRRT